MAHRRAAFAQVAGETSLILAESEAIGGFVGIALSEFVLQGAILLSVFGHMFVTQQVLAFACLLVFSPQFVFVPLMQITINRRVQSRVTLLREASIDLLLARGGEVEVKRVLKQELRFAEIFQLNLRIFKVKFS